MFPLIKGPLSNIDPSNLDDTVAIYSTVTGSANDLEAGAPPSEIALSADFVKTHPNDFEKRLDGKQQKSTTVQYEIKKFEEAMKAGSVVPIHYMDGALMAKTGLAMSSVGLTMIHDAIMAPIDKMFETAQQYNKAVYDLMYGPNKYSLVDSLLAALVRTEKAFGEASDKDKQTMVKAKTKVYKYAESAEVDNAVNAVKDAEGKTAYTQYSVIDYLENAKKSIELLKEHTDKAFEALGNTKNLVITHMSAASKSSAYSANTRTQTKAETKAEDDTIQEDSKDKIFTALQALLGKSGKKELDRLATMMKDC